jgi:hypothetical protein
MLIGKTVGGKKGMLIGRRWGGVDREGQRDRARGVKAGGIRIFTCQIMDN